MEIRNETYFSISRGRESRRAAISPCVDATEYGRMSQPRSEFEVLAFYSFY